MKIKLYYLFILLGTYSQESCSWAGSRQTETKKIVSTYKNGNPEIVNYFPDKEDTLTYRQEVFYESGKQNYIGNIVKEPRTVFGPGGMKTATKKSNVNMQTASMLILFIIGMKAGNWSKLKL